jgi:hypothetical protein
MPNHHDDELPSLDSAALAQVTGGTGDMMSMMLPMLMMRRGGGGAAQAAPAPQPAPTWKPKILVDGVEQSLTNNGGTFTTEV